MRKVDLLLEEIIIIVIIDRSVSLRVLTIEWTTLCSLVFFFQPKIYGFSIWKYCPILIETKKGDTRIILASIWVFSYLLQRELRWNIVCIEIRFFFKSVPEFLLVFNISWITFLLYTVLKAWIIFWTIICPHKAEVLTVHIFLFFF